MYLRYLIPFSLPGDLPLEQQLRSDCLKEGLTVDELDRAIYLYYENLKTDKTSLVRKGDRYEGHNIVAKNIGKSSVRVAKAIDRFEFKRDNFIMSKKI